jgi:hypothetical protein
MPIAVKPGPEGWVADWCFFRGIRPTEAFFEQTVMRALGDPARALCQRECPLSDLAELGSRNPGIPPSGFIFHLSRCGSTLVSRMLASLGRTLVISEAPAWDQLLRLLGSGALGSRDKERGALQGLVSAMAQPRSGEDRFFMKFDCWHVRDLPAIVGAYPEVPWIFLYRDPVEVLVSHRRRVGAQMVPGLVDPARLGLDPSSVDPSKTGEYAARVLAQLCLAAAEHAGLGRGLLINYRELPDAAWGRVARHFGLELSQGDRVEMEAAARFDAKSHGVIFEADSGRKRSEAGPDITGLACEWLVGPYESLEKLRMGQA